MTITEPLGIVWVIRSRRPSINSQNKSAVKEPSTTRAYNIPWVEIAGRSEYLHGRL
jgi:hypothetical protein